MLEVVVRSYALQASTVPFLAFPLGVSSHVFLFPAVFGFLPGGGTTRRSDSVIGQYLNDILDLSVVVGFLARRDQAALGILHQGAKIFETSLAAFRQQCSVCGHDRLCAVRERGRVAQTTVFVVRFWFLDSDASKDPLGLSEH